MAQMKKRKVLKSGLKYDFPSDIWLEILSRLPCKTIIRWGAICKSWRESWRGLIGDLNFIRLHLNRFNNNSNETEFVTIQGRFGNERCVVKSCKTFRTNSTLGSLQSSKMSESDTFAKFPAVGCVKNWHVVSSIDGLIMLQGRTIDKRGRHVTELMLWNPSIQKARMLPHSRHSRLPDDKMTCYDFGLVFDKSTNDYKSFRFVGLYNLNSVEVYTLAANSWETIQFRGKKFNYALQYAAASQKHLYFEGCLYLIGWAHLTGPVDLVSFDLNTGVFSSTPLPKDIYVGIRRDVLTLADGGDSLAVFYFSGARGTLWVLEKFGDGIKSAIWNKRYNYFSIISELYPDCIKYGVEYLYLKKNGDIFVKWRKVVTRCNILSDDEEIVVIDDAPFDMDVVGPYMESLILIM